MKRVRIPLWLRYITIAAGIAVLIWLPFEDTSTFWVSFLAAIISLNLSLYAAVRWNLTSQTPPWRLLIHVILSGLAVVPISILLIVLKSGVHAHGAPEYSFRQIITMLLRMPLWILGISITGLGLVLWRYFHSSRAHNE